MTKRGVVAALLQLVGLLILAAGVGAIRWWLGLVVLGAGLVAYGIATELEDRPKSMIQELGPRSMIPPHLTARGED